MDISELVVFYGMSFYKTDEGYFCNGAFGRYVDLLSEKYDKLFLVVPVIEDKLINFNNYYKIHSKKIIIQGLSYYSGYISALIKNKKIKNDIKKMSIYWKSPVYIRHPNPFTKYVYCLAKKKNLPIVLHLVGDTNAVINKGTKYKGVIKFFAISYLKYHDYTIKKIIKNNYTLVNGNGLRRFYSSDNDKIKEIRTSSFFQSEVCSKIKQLNTNPVKLLYVGYLRHEKGLDYLIEAIVDLKKTMNVELTIVGVGDYSDHLKEKINNLNLFENIKFKGHVELGEKLFSIYQDHDIFILPSISEGTPRVLLEAMCNGLPVIATNVGGIPYTIKNKKNGILIESKSSKSIVDAIKLLINDDILRKTIVKNGYSFALNNTLECHVDEVYDYIVRAFSFFKSKKLYHYSNRKRYFNFIFVSIPIHFIMIVTGLIPNSTPANKIRGLLLRPFFKSAGKNLQIASGVIINHINNIIVGENVYIAHNSWINGAGKIILEDNVIVGPYSVLVTTEHQFINGLVDNKATLVAPIYIKKGTWIASHVVVTSGIAIGENCLIAAGAVVTKDVESRKMYGGVPAKEIRDL